MRFTSLTADEIDEYSGSRKEVRPVTIATYQVLTTKRKGVYPHLDLLDSHDWAVEEASANPFDHVISDVMAAAINGKNGEEETRSIAAHDEAQVQQVQTAAEPGSDEAPGVKVPEPQPAMAAQPEASRPSPVVESEAFPWLLLRLPHLHLKKRYR